jgi:sortase A
MAAVIPIRALRATGASVTSDPGGGTSTAAPAPAPQPAAAAPPSEWRERRLLVGVTIWLLGALVLGFVVYLGVFSGLEQNRRQAVLFDRIRYELSHGTVPSIGPIADGTPVAVLTIPSLHLRQVVVEGSTSRDLMNGPGVEAGTPLPGQVGNSYVFGRRATFGAPFAKLGSLRAGDPIYVASSAGRLTYTVDGVWHSNHQFSERSVTSRITLGTSDPAWHPSRSLYVTAALTSGTPAAADTANASESYGAPLASDHGAALPLYLWAQLAFLAVLALLRYHGRVHRSVLWVGGLPFLLVVLWHIYPDLAALLPNTL